MAVVYVQGDIEKAIKRLHKMVQREGIFRELKLRNFYEKPSERKVREAKEAVRRRAKALRKKRDRETGVQQTSRYRRPEANKDL